MMTMTDNQRIANDRIQERIHDAEQYTKLHPRQHRQRKQHRQRRRSTGRHRIAIALHRLADRVEPSRRPALTVPGR